MRYDPDKPPDPEAWLALDEQEGIRFIFNYHKRRGIRMPNAMLHAVFHCIVEKQIALGDVVVVQTMGRLQREGLSRHNVIHAIAIWCFGDIRRRARLQIDPAGRHRQIRRS
jgi:hypothetical protein